MPDRRWSQSARLGILSLGIMLWIDVGSMLSAVFGLSFAVGSAVVLLMLCAEVLRTSLRSKGVGGRALSPRMLMIVAACYFAFDAVVLLRLGNHLSPAQLVVIAVGTCVLFAYALFPRRQQPRVMPFVWLAMGFGFLLRAVSQTVVRPEMGGDMLPLVTSALRAFSAGHSPYATHLVPWPLPLTYLPLCFLAYLPPYLLGLDIRLTNTLAQLLLFVPVVWLTLPPRGPRRPHLESPATATAALLWCVLFLAPSPLAWSLSNTHSVFWLLLALVYTLTVRGHLLAAALCLGLLLGESLLANVALAFLALCFWRQSGGVRAALLCLLAGVVALAVVLPFYTWAPGDFIRGVWTWHGDLNLAPRSGWVAERIWEKEIGLSGLFWRHGKEQWLKPLQMAALGGLALAYMWLGARPRHLGAFLCMAYAIFICLNSMLLGYLLFPVAVASILAVASLEGVK